jgi:SOS-response transcriptional repressor LexA
MESNAERRRMKLETFCKERGLKAVAEAAGLNWQYIDQAIKKTLLPAKKDGTRGYRKMSDVAFEKIEDAFNLGRGWFDGIGTPTANFIIEPSRVGKVPIVSWVQARKWCGGIEIFEPGNAEKWLPCPITHGPRTYALIVRGISMFDPTGAYSFKDCDMIFVDPERDAGHRSLVVARLDDEHEATFKQLIIEGDRRMLQALNPSWPNRIIPVNGNCSICGVVIGKVESFI